MGIWPNSTGMIPWGSPTKVVKTVLVDYTSKSRGQKIGFQNATFKNLLVRNYKADSLVGKLQTTATLELLMGIWPTLTRMIPWWSPTKVVLIDCISRSRGQKIDFQNATFKNLLDQNYKTQRFHIWYITSSRGPLPKLFKLCHWGQNWPPRESQFYINI